MTGPRNLPDELVERIDRAQFSALKAGLRESAPAFGDYDRLSERTRRIRQDQIRGWLAAAWPEIEQHWRHLIADEIAVAISRIGTGGAHLASRLVSVARGEGDQ